MTSGITIGMTMKITLDPAMAPGLLPELSHFPGGDVIACLCPAQSAAR